MFCAGIFCFGHSWWDSLDGNRQLHRIGLGQEFPFPRTSEKKSSDLQWNGYWSWIDWSQWAKWVCKKAKEKKTWVSVWKEKLNYPIWQWSRYSAQTWTLFLALRLKTFGQNSSNTKDNHLFCSNLYSKSQKCWRRVCATSLTNSK